MQAYTGVLRSQGAVARRLPALSIVTGVLSFEFVFVMFLFAGQYKGDPRFAWIPYDATVFFGIVNFLQGVCLTISSKRRINPAGLPVVICGSVFAFYVLLSLLWCSGVNYATYKAAYIATICLWCLGAPALFITGSPVRFQRFIRILLLFAAWVTVECILFYVQQRGQFGHVVQIHAMGDEGAYIGLGRIVCFGLVVTSVLWLFGCPEAWSLRGSRFVTIGLSFLFLAGSMTVGARGPVLAMVLAVMFVGIVCSVGTPHGFVVRKIWRIVAIAILAYMVAYMYEVVVGDLPLIVKRTLAFSSASEFYDVSGQSFGRLELFRTAFQAWLERPCIGHGIGSFPIISGEADKRLFPHNLVLELLCELGLIGTVLFFVVPCVAYVVRHDAWDRTDIRIRAMIIAQLVYVFANTMTSGDIPDNRVAFLAIGLLAYRDQSFAEERSKFGKS